MLQRGVYQYPPLCNNATEGQGGEGIIPERLIDIFSPPKRKRIGGGRPRAKGTKAEILLLDQLTQQGYEVRRTHLSLFPDIIAWTDTDLLLIEVKARSVASGKRGISDSLSKFKRGMQSMSSIPRRASIFCYILVGDEWLAYVWRDGAIAQVTPRVSPDHPLYDSSLDKQG